MVDFNEEYNTTTIVMSVIYSNFWVNYHDLPRLRKITDLYIVPLEENFDERPGEKNSSYKITIGVDVITSKLPHLSINNSNYVKIWVIT